jgi:hypothetical protein
MVILFLINVSGLAIKIIIIIPQIIYSQNHNLILALVRRPSDMLI